MDGEHVFKTLIIGDSSVGKSNLLLRFSDNIFHDTFLPTIGVDFKIKSVNVYDKSIKLNIWDTAGQDRFKTITQAYYKGAHGIVVVFDITERNSFEHVQNWFQEIKKNAGETVVKILVGNKVDLQESRAVQKSEGEALARSLGVLYVETSAKTGENVDSVFMNLSKQIYDALPENEKNPGKQQGASIDGQRRKSGASSCC